MSALGATAMLTARALRQFPRMPAVLVFSLVPPTVMLLIFGNLFESLTKLPEFPTDEYVEYLAPTIVLITAVFGIANAAVLLVTDFETRYFYKLLTTPTPVLAVMAARLFADGARVYVTAGLILLLAIGLGARVETGLAGALLILLLATLFSLFSVGTLMAIVALRTKDAASVQAVFPVFFILTFLTTGFMPRGQIDSDALRAIIAWNPAEYVIRAMRDLMLTGYDAGHLGIAFAVIAGFAALGVPLTVATYRSVYK